MGTTASPPPHPKAPAPGARRAPAQKRSRDRMQAILDAASRLIADKGSDQVRMIDVAQGAGISIGSLYQYFPEKAAIIRTLAERYGTESRRCIEEALRNVADSDGLQTAFLDLYDQYHALFLAEPVMRDIWSGMQADAQLRDLELAESRACAAILAEAMLRTHPKGDADAIAASAFLIWHLGEATMRLAISLDRREGDGLIAAFKRMAWGEIAARTTARTPAAASRP